METLLSQTTEGQLVKFKNNSDVYRVQSKGYFVTLLNMYTEKEMTIKTYTMKGGKMHDRKVEVVSFY
jgi:hypothetical protein